VSLQRWRGADYERLQRELHDVAAAWRLERLCVDGSGLGGPLAAGLERELGARVERVVFTPGIKSELGYALIAAANTGTLALYSAAAYDANLERCFDELRNCRADFRESGRMAWSAARGHDDHAVSLALCLRAAQSVGGPRVAIGRRGAT
jgi:phage FluMu gp28-like protein